MASALASTHLPFGIGRGALGSVDVLGSLHSPALAPRPHNLLDGTKRVPLLDHAQAVPFHDALGNRAYPSRDRVVGGQDLALELVHGLHVGRAANLWVSSVFLHSMRDQRDSIIASLFGRLGCMFLLELTSVSASGLQSMKRKRPVIGTRSRLS